MEKTQGQASEAGYRNRIAGIIDRAKAIDSAPILSKAKLAQEAVGEVLEVLYDIGAELDAMRPIDKGADQ